jgi:hypothetical protein
MNELIEEPTQQMCEPPEEFLSEDSWDSWHILEDANGNRECVLWANSTMGPFGKGKDHIWWFVDTKPLRADDAADIGWKYIKPIKLYGD